MWFAGYGVQLHLHSPSKPGKTTQRATLREPRSWTRYFHCHACHCVIYGIAGAGIFNLLEQFKAFNRGSNLEDDQELQIAAGRGY